MTIPNFEALRQFIESQPGTPEAKAVSLGIAAILQQALTDLNRCASSLEVLANNSTVLAHNVSILTGNTLELDRYRREYGTFE